MPTIDLGLDPLIFWLIVGCVVAFVGGLAGMAYWDSRR